MASSRARATARRGGHGLVADIDDMGLALLVEMGERGAHGRPCSPQSSICVAVVTSSCRIRLSPTRKVPIPAFSSSCSTSAWVVMPLSDDQMRAAGHAERQVDRGLQRRLEGAQVAVVDADELGVERQRPVELDLVVHLDQRIHAPLGGGVEQVARGVVADGGEDDQDAVGAPGARLSATW